MTIFNNEDAEVENWVLNPGKHKSRLSEILWFSYAAGSQVSWVNGKLSLKTNAYKDTPYLSGFPQLSDGALAPIDWINNLIELLDVVIPCSEIIQGCIDDDILTLKMAAPAFNMPSLPTPMSAAECLLSSRVMYLCLADVIPPDLVSNERAAKWFEQVSMLSLLLGGEEAFLMAMEIANNPNTYKLNDIPQEQILVFEGEE